MKLSAKAIILLGAVFFNTTAGIVTVADPHRSSMECMFGALIFGALITLGMFVVGYICIFSVAEKDVNLDKFEKFTHYQDKEK